MKIEGLKIEILPQPGDEFFDRLAKEFAVAVYNHFVTLWQENEQEPFCGFLEASDPAEAQQDRPSAGGE